MTTHGPQQNKYQNIDAWVGHVTTAYLHSTGWREANQGFAEITRAARIFANRTYQTSNSERAAFFDGFTFGLLALTHAHDIEKLEALWTVVTPESLPTKRQPS